MAEKFLNYEGLAYFKEKLDLEYEGKIPEIVQPLIPQADGETIIDNDGIWSAKLPEGGAITAGDDGLELDLTKIAGDTLYVSDGSLEVVIDGTTIKADNPDPNTGKTELYVDLSGIVDGDTIINNGGKLEVDPSALDIPDAYTLPAATSSTLGGIKVGNGLEMVESTASSGEYDKLQAKAGNATILVDSYGIKVNPQKVPTLGDDGKISEGYLPSYVDDVIEGWFVPGDPDAEPAVPDIFYLTRTEVPDSDPVEYTYSDPITNPESNKIYVDLASTDTYRWSGSVYVNISGAAIDIITEEDIDLLFPADEP